MAPSWLDHIAIMVISEPFSVISKQPQENAMHPIPVAPRGRANPADFPALSRGSAAPTFVDVSVPTERQGNRCTVMHHASPVRASQAAADPVSNRISSAAVISDKSLIREPFTRLADRRADPSVLPAIVKSSGLKDLIVAITEGAAIGLVTGTVAGSRVGPVGALVGAFVFGGLCMWNRIQRHNTSRNGT